MSNASAIKPELLTTREAAAICGIGERSLCRYSADGRAPRPVKVGGSTRFRRADLLDWIAAGCPRIGGEEVQK